MPDFWSDAHTAEVHRLRRLRALYDGHHELHLHIGDGSWSLPLYVTHNWLGDRYTKTLSTLIWRGWPYLEPAEEARKGDLDALIADTGLRTALAGAEDVASYAGYATLKLWKPARSTAPRVRRWGTVTGEFAWWELEGDIPYAVTFYRDEVIEQYRGLGQRTVRIGERFALDGGTVQVTNRAYLVSGAGVDLKTPVALAEIFPEASPRDLATLEESTLPMPVLPACLVVGAGVGASDYTPSLISLQKSMARLASQRDIAIAINEMPVMNVPVSALTPDGRVDLGKLWVTLREDGQDPRECVPINLNSWTGNLNESARQWELNEASFYALTGLSPAIDGQAAGAGESGYARRLGLLKTEAKVADRRAQREAAFAWAGIAVPAFAQTQERCTQYGSPIERISVTWPPAIPDDPAEVAQRVESATRGGYMSTEQAIREMHPEWTPQQVSEEAERIKADARERTANSLPTFSLGNPVMEE